MVSEDPTGTDYDNEESKDEISYWDCWVCNTLIIGQY